MLTLIYVTIFISWAESNRGASDQENMRNYI